MTGGMGFLDEGGAFCIPESAGGGDVAAPEDECQMGTAFGQTAGATEALSDPEDVDMSEQSRTPPPRQRAWRCVSCFVWTTSATITRASMLASPSSMVPPSETTAKAASLSRKKLKEVLQAMRGTPQPPQILPDSVRAVCAFLDVPGLEAAYPSEPDPVQNAAPVQNRR